MTGLKKNQVSTVEVKRQTIERDHPQISVKRQCELLGLNRSTLYYQPVAIAHYTLLLMRLIDEQFTRTPFYGVRRIWAWLDQQGHFVSQKRVRRLMRRMGLTAIYPKPNLSRPNVSHKIYPYLLRGVVIRRVDQVWSTDITYIRLRQGFIYLVAVIDWYSRYVLSWSISTTLEIDFCLDAQERSLLRGTPETFNSDQGSQFTSPRFTEPLVAQGIRVSMDGRGRALDNIFVERLWRSVKYEEVYLNEYANVTEARQGIAQYMKFYNEERLHQSLDYQTPHHVYFVSKSTTTSI